MPGMEPCSVLALNEDLLNRGKSPRHLRAARFGQGLPVEDQRVLREVDDQRQADRNPEENLEQ
jgi:hypothetical protein